MQFVINKTTTETFAIEADNAKDATDMAKRGEGNQIVHDERINVSPRPQQPAGPTQVDIARAQTRIIKGTPQTPTAPVK